MTSSTCIRAPEESISPQRCATSSGASGVPSAASRTFASAVGSASSASATSTVRLPSIRSSPAGLPVTDGSPKTPSRSSRSWKASPSGRPNRVSWAICSGDGAGEGGADVQRALDGVLRGLVAQHRHRGVDVGRAASLRRDVEELAGDDLAAGQVEVAERVDHALGGQAAGAQHLVGPAEQQVAEQDRGRGAVLLGARGPAPLAVQLPRRRGGWPAGRVVRRRRPCSRRAPARSRAAAPATRRRGAARTPRREPRRTAW